MSSVVQRAGGVLPLPAEFSSTNTGPVNFGSLPAAGNSIFVFISENRGAGTLGVLKVEDNQGGVGGAYVAVAQIAAGTAGKAWLYVRQGITAPSGTFTVTVTMNGTTFFDVGIAEVTGIATQTPNTNTNTGTSGSQSTGAASPPGGGTGFYAGVLTGNNTNLATLASGFTEAFNEPSSGVAALGGESTTGSGSKNLTWTTSNSPAWGAAIAVYDDSGGTVTSSQKIPAEFLAQLKQPGIIPVEWLGSFKPRVFIPTDWLASAVGRPTIPLAWKGPVPLVGLKIPVEWSGVFVPTTVDVGFKSWSINSVLEMTADSYQAEIPDSATYLAARRGQTITIEGGLYDASNTAQSIQAIVNGSIDEWELNLNAAGRLSTKIKGRDASFNILDTYIQKTYGMSPFVDTIQETNVVTSGGSSTETPRIPTSGASASRLASLGPWTASKIAADILLTAGVPLTLSWEIRDYNVLETFDATGRIIDAIKKLVEPFMLVEPFKADIFVRNGVLIIRYRNQPNQIHEPDLSMDLTTLRRTNLKIRKRPMRKIGRVILRGQKVPQGLVVASGTDGAQQGSNLTLAVTSKTFDANGNVVAMTDTTFTYLLPARLLETEIKTTYTNPTGGSLTLTARESLHREYTFIGGQFTAAGPIKAPNISAETTVHEGFRLDNGAWAILQIDEVSHQYDQLQFMIQSSNLVKKLNTKGSMERVSMVIETHRDLAPLMVERIVENYVFSTQSSSASAALGSQSPVLVSRQSQVSGGYRPGGPSPSRLGASGNQVVGSVTAIVDRVLIADATLQIYTYENANLNTDDLNFIADEFAAANNLYEYEVVLMGVAVPWLRRGMYLQITGLTAEDGVTAIPIPVLLVSEVNTQYTEDGTPSYTMPTVRGFAWSTT